MNRLISFSKHYHLALVVTFCILGFMSCEQETIDNPDNPSTPQVVRLTASLEDESAPSTRTSLDENGTSILWTANDRIKVFTKTALGGAIFESTNTSLSRQTDFEGMLDITGISAESPLVAVYPYADDTVYDGNDVTITFPSVQEAFADGFSDHLLPALAVSSDLNLSFTSVQLNFLKTNS